MIHLPCTHAWRTLLSVFLLLLPLTATDDLRDAQGRWKGRKVYDSTGQWHGLFNCNPDPQGEPWIAGGIPPRTPEQEAFFKNLPVYTHDPAAGRRTLPRTIDHTASPYMRPVFTQRGSSCGQASGIGYHYTFEHNQALAQPCTNNTHISSYIFSWNQVNGGIDKGSWPEWGYIIAQHFGMVRESDFSWDNGTCTTNWPSGHQVYRNALDCRVSTIISFGIPTVATLKSWLCDKGTGQGQNGGLITFACRWPLDTSTLIPAGPFQGQRIVTTVPWGYDHAVTLAGYSDEITVNGKTGAFLLLNSHGTDWANGGKVWVAYDAFEPGKNYSFCSVTVEPYQPRLLIKASIRSLSRNDFYLKTGTAPQADAPAPTTMRERTWGFRYSGGSHPMQGSGKSDLMEMVFDATPLIGNLTEGRGTLFLQVFSSDGIPSGQVEALSAVHLRDSAEVVFPYPGSELGVPFHAEVTNFGIPIDLNPPHLALLSPNGGETLRHGDRVSIVWTCQGISSPLILELITPDQVAHPIVEGMTPASGQYTWTVGTLKDGTTPRGPGLRFRIRTRDAKSTAEQASLPTPAKQRH